MNKVIEKKEENYIEEDGKLFYKTGDYYTRLCDANYSGKQTNYNRCEKCGKLVSRQWQQYHRSLEDCTKTK